MYGKYDTSLGSFLFMISGIHLPVFGPINESSLAYFPSECNCECKIPSSFFFVRVITTAPAPSPKITDIFLPLVVISSPPEWYSEPITKIFLYIPVLIN